MLPFANLPFGFNQNRLNPWIREFSAPGCRGPVHLGTGTALGVVALRQQRPWLEARRRRGRHSRATG